MNYRLYVLLPQNIPAGAEFYLITGKYCLLYTDGEAPEGAKEVQRISTLPELENPGCVPVIYPIRAGGPGCTDPDSEMLRYAEIQFENQNVQILTADYNAGIDAYKKLHRLKDDRSDGIIFRPYQKTQELIGQIQNLKKVVSGAGFSERRISNKIQRDSWSALKYALRLAQKLEERYLAKAAGSDGSEGGECRDGERGDADFSAPLKMTRWTENAGGQ